MATTPPSTPGGRWRAWATCVLALALLTLCPQPVVASPWSGRTAVSAAMMLSNDQVKAMGYDSAGFLAGAALSRTLISRLSAQWTIRGGTFLSDPRDNGSLLGTTLGLRLHSVEREIVPYFSVDGGVGFTGKLARPWIGAAFGVDWYVKENVTMGPIVGFDDLIQWNRPRHSTDALFLWLGLSVSFCKAYPKPAPVRKTGTRVITRERERVVEAPPSDPKELELLIERTIPSAASRLELLAPVLFALDSDQLEPIGVAMLHEVANTLRTRPEIVRLEVQGYADVRGGEAYNQALSQRRAERVRSWLIEHGIAPERLVVAAHGATAPVEADASEGAYQQNRRVVFRVLELAEP